MGPLWNFFTEARGLFDPRARRCLNLLFFDTVNKQIRVVRGAFREGLSYSDRQKVRKYQSQRPQVNPCAASGTLLSACSPESVAE